MRVADLITMLQKHQDKYGADAQIAVPRSKYQREIAAKAGVEDPNFGEEIFIKQEPIATYLNSRGDEIEW